MLGAIGRMRLARRRRVVESHDYGRDLSGGEALARGGPDLVAAVRDWMLVCDGAALAAFVTLPSQAVAAAWRELAAREDYPAFCRRAFGELLLPLPLDSRPADRREDGLRRTWAIACRRAGIDPRRPDRLPRLFTIDADVGWEGGMRWEPADDDPPVRLAGGPEPSVACAWPELPNVEALLPPRGRHGIPP